METFQISLGEKMEFRPQLPDGTFSTSTFSSQVQNIISDNEFQIFPLTDSNPDSWIGRILLSTVVQDCKPYEAVVEVKKMSSEGNLRFFDLVIKENFKPQQRRDFYRLKYKLDIEIDGHGKFKTYDISGSGLSFLSDKEFIKNAELAITLYLPDDQYDIRGAAVRCNKYLAEKFLVSVNFKNVGEKIQNEIARFLQQQQIVMIRKGIL